MKKESKLIEIAGSKVRTDLIFTDESDRENLKELYSFWIQLNRGMKQFESRGINLPEGISETAFCLEYNKDCARVIKTASGPASFDAINIKTGNRIQIKACSVKFDLTSFGPKSVWDALYFLDFFREGKFDGTFDVYEIPNELIYEHKVNRDQTFKDQQKQGRRPRFSIKRDIIIPNKLKPNKTCKI